MALSLRGGRALILVAVVALLVIVRWGLSAPRPTVTTAVTGAVTALVVLVVVRLLVLVSRWRAARSLGPVSWRFSPAALTIVGVGSSVLEWSTFDRFAVRGDLLVLRPRARRQVRVGALVGPLSAVQRERVLGWVAAGAASGPSRAR